MKVYVEVDVEVEMYGLVVCVDGGVGVEGNIGVVVGLRGLGGAGVGVRIGVMVRVRIGVGVVVEVDIWVKGFMWALV